MKVVWSRKAHEDAIEQAIFISQDKKEAARRWIANLFAFVKKLEALPRSGRVVPEIGAQDLRELDFNGFRVIYRIELKRVVILTVRHSRRLLHSPDLEAREK
jgi:toxin ParE1/3/4